LCVRHCIALRHPLCAQSLSAQDAFLMLLYLLTTHNMEPLFLPGAILLPQGPLGRRALRRSHQRAAPNSLCSRRNVPPSPLPPSQPRCGPGACGGTYGCPSGTAKRLPRGCGCGIDGGGGGGMTAYPPITAAPGAANGPEAVAVVPVGGKRCRKSRVLAPRHMAAWRRERQGDAVGWWRLAK